MVYFSFAMAAYSLNLNINKTLLKQLHQTLLAIKLFLAAYSIPLISQILLTPRLYQNIKGLG